MLQHVGVLISDVSRQMEAKDTFQDILSSFFKTSKETTRVLKAKMGVELVKRLHLDGSYGNIGLIASTMAISRNFAARIISATLNDNLNTLILRKSPRIAFHNSGWPEKLRDYAMRPENSRAVPGIAS